MLNIKSIQQSWVDSFSKNTLIDNEVIELIPPLKNIETHIQDAVANKWPAVDLKNDDIFFVSPISSSTAETTWYAKSEGHWICNGWSTQDKIKIIKRAALKLSDQGFATDVDVIDDSIVLKIRWVSKAIVNLLLTILKQYPVGSSLEELDDISVRKASITEIGILELVLEAYNRKLNICSHNVLVESLK